MDEKEVKGLDELKKLMEKIDIAMEMSRDKKEDIDKREEELYNEIRPMMVEKRKEELKDKREGKEEFDEMTKNAMINAKKSILLAKEMEEKKYQEMLMQTAKKQRFIQGRLASIKKRDDFSDDKKQKIEMIAKKNLDSVNSKMSEAKKEHFEQKSKLEGYEKSISTYAMELGVEKELSNVVAESKAAESKAAEPKAAEPKAAEPKAAEPKAAEPIAAEPIAAEPIAAEPIVAEPIAAEPIVAEPTVAESIVAEPTVAEPIVAEPTVAEPIAAEPIVAEPIAAESMQEETKKKQAQIRINANKGIVVFEKNFKAEDGSKRHFFDEIDLDSAFSDKKEIRKEMIKSLKENDRDDLLKVAKKLKRKLNPAVLKVLLDNDEIDMLTDYICSLNEKNTDMLPFSYNIEIGESYLVTEKTLRQLNKQALRDNKNLGTDFDAIKHYGLKKFFNRLIKNNKLLNGKLERLPVSRLKEEKEMSAEEKELKVAREKQDKFEEYKKSKQEKYEEKELGGTVGSQYRAAMKRQEEFVQKVLPGSKIKEERNMTEDEKELKVVREKQDKFEEYKKGKQEKYEEKELGGTAGSQYRAAMKRQEEFVQKCKVDSVAANEAARANANQKAQEDKDIDAK